MEVLLLFGQRRELLATIFGFPDFFRKFDFWKPREAQRSQGNPEKSINHIFFIFSVFGPGPQTAIPSFRLRPLLTALTTLAASNTELMLWFCVQCGQCGHCGQWPEQQFRVQCGQCGQCGQLRDSSATTVTATCI